jgi:hypothetical protein
MHLCMKFHLLIDSAELFQARFPWLEVRAQRGRVYISMYEGNAERKGSMGIFYLYDWQHCWGLVML